MDIKLTLSFNEEVIIKAKKFAADRNISLSRLTELLLTKAVTTKTYSFDDYPVADWVNMIAEPTAEYQRKKTTSKNVKNEYFIK